MWPVIIRELRVAGRDVWSKWYRVLAAASVLLIGWFTQLFEATNNGSALFATIHLVLFCIIWIFVPLATADCISKERREGTLGLLFLTPLKAWDIVIAKSFVQASRAAFMWLAAVPVLTLSFLMGGVTRWEVALSVFIHFSSLCCALAAGILASGRSTEWGRAMVAAVLTSIVLLVCFLEFQIWLGVGSWGVLASGISLSARWWSAFSMATNFQSEPFRVLSAAQTMFYKPMLLTSFASIVLLAAAIWSTGLAVRRSVSSKQHQEPASLRVGRKLLFPKLHRAWSRRRLNRNPVGWLEQRTWTARMLQWGWLAIMIGVSAVTVQQVSSPHDYAAGHRAVGWGLLAALGMAAAGSFRRERENGMLSLMLVTPLRPDQIVMGRVKGLWAQIQWATILFVGGWVYLQGFSHGYTDYLWMLFFTVSYLTLPVTGLFCSLWRKTYFGAVLWTFFLGMFYPLGVACLCSLTIIILLQLEDFWPTALVVAALVQIGIACVRGRELIQKLESRSFAF